MLNNFIIKMTYFRIYLQNLNVKSSDWYIIMYFIINKNSRLTEGP